MRVYKFYSILFFFYIELMGSFKKCTKHAQKMIKDQICEQQVTICTKSGTSDDA